MVSTQINSHPHIYLAVLFLLIGCDPKGTLLGVNPFRITPIRSSRMHQSPDIRCSACLYMQPTELVAAIWG